MKLVDEKSQIHKRRKSKSKLIIRKYNNYLFSFS